MSIIDWFYDKFLWRRSESRSYGGLGSAVGKVIAQKSEAPEPKPAPAKHEKHVKIGVIVGHESDAKGAKMCAPYNHYEYDFNKVVAYLMADYARTKGVECAVILRDDIDISGAYKKARAAECSAVIELHFNAHNGMAYGTETLCSSEDKAFADKIQSAMCSLFGRHGKGDRGIKIRDTGRGSESCVSFPGKANCLVEGFFGDNPQDAKMGVELKRPYAHCLVDACLRYLGKD